MRFRRTGRTGQSSPSSRPDPSPEPISQVLKDLLEELQSRREPKRPPRDWIQIIATALPGLAALIALIFTWQSINATTDATNRQLQVAGQGQVTDRYNAAITNLGSSSVDVRLGGIYALQRIMQDSRRDQPTIIAVLCAFVRKPANAATARSGRPSASPRTSSGPSRQPTDIQAAMTVVGTRDTAHDSSTTVVDFMSAYLTGADLDSLRLSNARLSSANLTSAHFVSADLTFAEFFSANLTGADLTAALLTGTDLTGAKGLPPGIPRSPTGRTPASTKNLRR
jgi:Pentapeptide repeats (8 copies)